VSSSPAAHGRTFSTRRARYGAASNIVRLFMESYVCGQQKTTLDYKQSPASAASSGDVKM
jgi:hypothetical protein